MYFAVKPTIEGNVEEIRVIIDSALGSAKDVDDTRVVRTLKVVSQQVGRKMLTETVETEDTRYVSFKIGVKTQ